MKTAHSTSRSQFNVALISALLTVVGLGAGCAGMQRSSASGYYGRDDDAPAPMTSREPASVPSSGWHWGSDDSDNADVRRDLRKAEYELEGKREREQYFKYKPYMRTDRDRLAFLRLNSYSARGRWLAAHGIQENNVTHPPEIQALVDVNDITTGMTKQAVRDSWGEPELVEVAGNPIYGTERWHYSEQIPSTDGYFTEHRLVYFEAGRVVGWKKE